jgi:glutaredoxin-related protein
MTPDQIAWLCVIAIIAATLVWGALKLWKMISPPSGAYRSIGTESLDYDAFNDQIQKSSRRQAVLSSWLPGSGTTRSHTAFDLKKIERPQTPRPSNYDSQESAENLVKGILAYNDIVLFVRNLNEFDTTSPDAKTRALLQEVGVAFKTVDVSKDPTMHLAFPEDGTEMSLPMVYANNKKIGSYDVIKKMHRDGTLDTLFSK